MSFDGVVRGGDAKAFEKFVERVLGETPTRAGLSFRSDYSTAVARELRMHASVINPVIG